MNATVLPMDLKRHRCNGWRSSVNSGDLDILLVEDNQDDIDLALHALRREKLANRIFVVHDGEEALDFLFCREAFVDRSFDHPPRLILLDLKLPKVDGMEGLKRSKVTLGPRTSPSSL